jgi:methylenetetrahydrofolate reductase (NADPH)
MNTLYRQDEAITEVFKKKLFTVSAEIIPSRNGLHPGELLSEIQQIVDAGVDFLSVTKGAGGSLRGGSLPISQWIKEKCQIPVIAHFTCRDLTAFEVENELIDHHYFGIRNILALRGDPPDGQPEWVMKPGGYAYAYQLIKQLQALNQGQYLERSGFKLAHTPLPTQFCIGAAVYPESKNLDQSIEYFLKKVDAGAQFGITDMLFDAQYYETFVKRLLEVRPELQNFPILPGTRILKSKKQARRVMDKFKVTVPPELFDQLSERETPESVERGIQHAISLTQRFVELGAKGIHLFIVNDASSSIKFLNDLKRISCKDEKK